MTSFPYAIPAIIAICILVAIVALIVGAWLESWFHRLRQRHESADHEMIGGNPL